MKMIFVAFAAALLFVESGRPRVHHAAVSSCGRSQNRHTRRRRLRMRRPRSDRASHSHQSGFTSASFRDGPPRQNASRNDGAGMPRTASPPSFAVQRSTFRHPPPGLANDRWACSLCRRQLSPLLGRRRWIQCLVHHTSRVSSTLTATNNRDPSKELAPDANRGASIKLQSLENDWCARRDRPCERPHGSSEDAG